MITYPIDDFSSQSSENSGRTETSGSQDQEEFVPQSSHQRLATDPSIISRSSSNIITRKQTSEINRNGGNDLVLESFGNTVEHSARQNSSKELSFGGNNKTVGDLKTSHSQILS